MRAHPIAIAKSWHTKSRHTKTPHSTRQSFEVEAGDISMPVANWRSAFALAAFGLLCAETSRAAIADYEFQLIEDRFKKGAGVAALRLIHKPDGRPVPDAVIFALRLDMAPDDMEAMTSPIEQTQSAEPGVYRFKIDLTDEGRWRISIAAKVQGEVGTLRSRLVVKATP
jgi:hypothetical protein